MLMPLLGLIMSAAVALLLAAAAVRFDRKLRPVTGALIAFVPSAFAGAILYTLIYVRLVGGESHQLRSEAAIIGYLAGTLISAALSGWVGARWFSHLWAGYGSDP